MIRATRLAALLVAIGFLLVAGVAPAGVLEVDGWMVNDNSYGNDAAGTYVEVAVDCTWGGANAEPYDWLNNFRWNAAGTGNDTATWSFLGLPNVPYDVAVSYSTQGNRATDAPYSVNGAAPVDVNQEDGCQRRPRAQRRHEQYPFEMIAEDVQVTGNTLSVVLTDDANEYVIADAVAITPVRDFTLSSTVPSPFTHPDAPIAKSGITATGPSTNGATPDNLLDGADHQRIPQQRVVQRRYRRHREQCSPG